MLHAQMPGSNPWFQALSRCEEHLFLLPDAEFNLVTQTSTFTELLDLTKWGFTRSARSAQRTGGGS